MDKSPHDCHQPHHDLYAHLLQHLSEPVREHLKSHPTLLGKLIDHKQEHLLADVNDLDIPALSKYIESIDAIDYHLMDMLYNELVVSPKPKENESNTITPIQNKFRQNGFNDTNFEEIRHKGLELIHEGKIAVVLLSGGQGSRLGFEHAKGMYDIGMPSGKTLFEYFANRISRVNQIAHEAFSQGAFKKTITWYLMTSEMNHEEIQKYFDVNNYFGLGEDNVKFFTQESMPALNTEGKILLEDKNKVNKSPNGNGGLFHSMFKNGVLQDMRTRGVKYVHVFGVDNVLAKPADPFFMGFIDNNGYDVACKYVPKKHPEERVGIHVYKDGKPAVVEYTEISKEMAYQKDDKDQLVYDTSHIVNSVYNIDFLDYIVKEGAIELVKEYHLAKKKIKYYHSESKEIITPADINGYKFELFIFDVFLLVKPEKFGLVEVSREAEFAPVKNAPGAAEDSPDTARELMTRLHQGWFEKQGVKFDKQGGKEKDSLFEIDARQVYDDKDLKLGVLADRCKDDTVKLPHFAH